MLFRKSAAHILFVMLAAYVSSQVCWSDKPGAKSKPI